MAKQEGVVYCPCGVVSSLDHACPVTYEQLQSQLTAAQAHIALLREALEDMRDEFKALDLPYGSKAYTKCNEVLAATKP